MIGCWACVRSTLAIETPNTSAWIIANANAFNSSTSVRSARLRNASARGTPSWISCSIRANSEDSTPGTFCTTCAIAAFSEGPRPDREQVEGVGQRPEDLLLAFFDPSVEDRVRRHEAHEREEPSTTIRMNGARPPIRDVTKKPRTMPPPSPMILNASTRSASHPDGLPARSSLRATRSQASIGVTRRATFDAGDHRHHDPTAEALGQMLLAEVHVLRRGAGDLRLEQTDRAPALRWFRSKKMPNSTTAPKTHPIATTSQTSDIDIHDLPHPEDPEHQQDPSHTQHEQSDAW